MGCDCSRRNEGFKIATINDEDKEKLSDLEMKFRNETGKEVVLIAWEKE